MRVLANIANGYLRTKQVPGQRTVPGKKYRNTMQPVITFYRTGGEDWRITKKGGG